MANCLVHRVTIPALNAKLTIQANLEATITVTGKNGTYTAIADKITGIAYVTVKKRGTYSIATDASGNYDAVGNTSNIDIYSKECQAQMIKIQRNHATVACTNNTAADNLILYVDQTTNLKGGLGYEIRDDDHGFLDTLTSIMRQTLLTGGTVSGWKIPTPKQEQYNFTIRMYIEINGVKYYEENSLTASGTPKIKLTIPTLSNTNIAVTGSSVSPTVNNYNSSLMNQSGTTSTSSVGSWTITWTLKDSINYCWSDGTTGGKSASWSTYAGTKAFRIPVRNASKASTTYTSITYYYNECDWNIKYGATWNDLVGLTCNMPYYEHWDGYTSGSNTNSSSNAQYKIVKSGTYGSNPAFCIRQIPYVSATGMTHRVWDANANIFITDFSQKIDFSHTYYFAYINIGGNA